MKRKQLNDHIKDYYQEQNLSSEKMERLIALRTLHENNVNKTRTTRWLKYIFNRNISIAAGILFLLLISLQWLPFEITDKNYYTNNLAMLISEEIALNHNKKLASEFSARNYNQLRSQMIKLDFTPIESSRLKNSGLKFLGARYCSIQGQLAAQIKLIDKNGRSQTLYQTQLNNKLKNLPEQEYYVDGVKIKQWQENGLFFGLASSADN